MAFALQGVSKLTHKLENDEMKKPYTKPAVLKRDSLATIAACTTSNPCPSDSRLKTAIVPAGTTSSGFNLYDFSYIGQPEVWRGVMAQEVLKTHPEAVSTGSNGFLAVDYGMLGLKMERVN